MPDPLICMMKRPAGAFLRKIGRRWLGVFLTLDKIHLPKARTARAIANTSAVMATRGVLPFLTQIPMKAHTSTPGDRRLRIGGRSSRHPAGKPHPA